MRRKGNCERGRLTTFCVLFAGEEERVGFSTAKGFRTAVARNRARRRLREAFGQVYTSLGRGCAIIGIATQESLSASFEDLKASVAQQLTALHLGTTDEG